MSTVCCRLCTKEFSKSSSLQMHIRNVHQSAYAAYKLAQEKQILADLLSGESWKSIHKRTNVHDGNIRRIALQHGLAGIVKTQTVAQLPKHNYLKTRTVRF